MSEDTGDKTEEPTAKKIADARKKGQVPRSKELNTFVSLITAGTMFLIVGRSVAEGLVQLMRQQFSLDRALFFDEASVTTLFSQVLRDGFLLVIPLMLVLTIVALLTPMMMGGWHFSMDSMSPKPSKMNPFKGLKRMFGPQGWMELLKSVIKTTVVFFVAGRLLLLYLNDFMSLSSLSLVDALNKAGDIIPVGFLIVSSTLILVVVIDVPYQLWHHKKQLKMSKQDIKDEHKQQEGSSDIKGQLRKKQMEMAQARMMDEVATAHVIITNPTHVAIALRYDVDGSGAPTVVAKGADFVAAQIRNRAMGVDIPLVSTPPLARALFYATELGEEIPEGLFHAVAQVLAYVFQLKTAKANDTNKPPLPTGLDIPRHFRQS
ncbi:MAG: flagellar biosynthesis protein FlhB [Methylococcales bacterium]|nr:flagellar biosynthesis protein FlhB [Methylococcales bacterium]